MAGRLFSGNLVLPWVRPVILIAAIVTSLFFSRGELGSIRTIASGQWIDKYWFPLRASEFISSHKLAGNRYNSSVVFVKDTPENRQVIAEAGRSVKKSISENR